MTVAYPTFEEHLTFEDIIRSLDYEAAPRPERRKPWVDRTPIPDGIDDLTFVWPDERAAWDDTTGTAAA